MKNRLWHFATLICTLFLFTNCQKDDETTTDTNSLNTVSGIRESIISFEEFSQHSAAYNALQQAAKGNDNNLKALVNDTINGFFYSTNNIVVFEYEDYRTYTFEIGRYSKTDDITENLVIAEKSSAVIASYIVEYTFDSTDKLNAINNAPINGLAEKSFITKSGGGIPDFIYQHSNGNCYHYSSSYSGDPNNLVYLEFENGVILPFTQIECPRTSTWVENGSGGGGGFPSYNVEIFHPADPGSGPVTGPGPAPGGGGSYDNTFPLATRPVVNLTSYKFYDQLLDTDLGKYQWLRLHSKLNAGINKFLHEHGGDYNDNIQFANEILDFAYQNTNNEELANQILEFLEDEEYTIDSMEIINKILDFAILEHDDSAVEFAKNWINLLKQIDLNPSLLIGLQESEVQNWLDLANYQIPTSVIEKINALDLSSYGDYNIQRLKDGKGAIVNMDLFAVNISTLPINPITNSTFTPKEFLKHIRLNINDFVNTSLSSFSPSTITSYNEHQIWNSSNPLTAIIHINIAPPAGDGSVICSKAEDDSWIFTTIEVPWGYGQGYDGIHPVSGNREFGLIENINGSYTFYTRGIDRMTDSFESLYAENTTIIGSAFDTPDMLWNSLRNGVHDFVENNSGNADNLNDTPPITFRPAWNQVRRVLIGEIPISELGYE